MNVLHISDIHFRESYLPCEEGYQGMLAAMQNPLIPLEECIQDAKARAAIDLVVISGDLTEDGAPADYASLKQYLEKAFGSVPIVVTLGNHDIKRHFRQGWQGKSVETASDTPFNQVYETETLAIVTFDNSCYGYADGIVDERQFEWLQATLAQLKEKNRFCDAPSFVARPSKHAGMGRCQSFGGIIAAVSNLLYSQWTYPSCVYGNDRRDSLLYCGKYVVCRGR